MLWDRDRLMGFMVGKGQGISGADHFWFGHTPVDKRYDFNNLHYIDTGQYSGLSDAGAASVINNPPSGGFSLGQARRKTRHRFYCRNAHGTERNVPHQDCRDAGICIPGVQLHAQIRIGFAGILNVRSPCDSPRNSASSISKAPMRTLVFVIMLSGLLPKIWYDQCSHPF